MMLREIIEKFAYFDINDNQVYASTLWLKLLAILDPHALHTFTEQYQNKIPLQIMVDFSQAHFLRKKDQRWALENYDDFSPETKEALNQLLDEYGQLAAQPVPDHSDFALFLGTSTANLAKRVFHLFDAIVNQHADVGNVIILGTDEPYDAFMSSIVAIIESHPDYFREGITAADVPQQATMHEVMCFLFDNLRWPADKKPNAIRLSQQRPCSTNKEIDAVSAYLSQNVLVPQYQSTLFKSLPKQCRLLVLSHQPFNDRQALVALTGSIKANIQSKVAIQVAGAGMTTYPILNTFPASTMSPAQLVDNLSRALYEINQNAKTLFTRKDVDEQADLFCGMRQ